MIFNEIESTARQININIVLRFETEYHSNKVSQYQFFVWRIHLITKFSTQRAGNVKRAFTTFWWHRGFRMQQIVIKSVNVLSLEMHAISWFFFFLMSSSIVPRLLIDRETCKTICISNLMINDVFDNGLTLTAKLILILMKPLHYLKGF